MSLYTLRPISDRTPFTGKPVYSDFDSTWSATYQLLARELRALTAKNVVLELDYRERDIRLDGQLRADAKCQSPAVRLAFDSPHGPLVYATDRFVGRGYRRRMEDWQHNVRAVALGLEALRKVDRYGISRSGEQYRGYRAIGAGVAMPASHMTFDEATRIVFTAARVHQSDWGYHEAREFLRAAKANSHPDKNDGDRTLWDQVEQAERVLTRSGS